ncbi:MAG: glycosyltransferase [bacterium]|nr:glycosyltransferase [bacterium]
MKVLIITYFFPPLNSVASLRLYSFAKYLTEFGLDVTVFTTPKKNILNDNDFFINNGYKVIELPIPKPFKIISINKLVNRFSKVTGVYYKNRFPDDSDRWLKPAVNYLKDFTFDVVISSYGPYVCHNIALNLKKYCRIKFWVADFRDLFTDSPIYTGIPFFYFIEKKMEQAFLNNADLITVVSQSMRNLLSLKTNKNIEVIYNGFFEENYDFVFNSNNLISFNSLKNPDSNNLLKILYNKDILKIVYTGTIYKSQKIDNLLVAISDLKKQGVLNFDNFRFILAGSYDIIYDIKKYNLEDIYIYLGLLDFKDSLRLQYLADILLMPLEEVNIKKADNIEKYKGILTGKLFEYLGLNLYKLTPIWVINKTIDDEKLEILINSGVSTIFFDDINKIKNYLIKFLKDKEGALKEYRVNNKFISQFSRKKQAEKLYRVITNFFNFNIVK